MIVRYYVLDDQAKPTVIYRLCDLDGWRATKQALRWEQDDEVYPKVTGLRGDYFATEIDRDAAMKILEDLGVQPDDVDLKESQTGGH